MEPKKKQVVKGILLKTASPTHTNGSVEFATWHALRSYL